MRQPAVSVKISPREKKVRREVLRHREKGRKREREKKEEMERGMGEGRKERETDKKKTQTDIRIFKCYLCLQDKSSNVDSI